MLVAGFFTDPLRIGKVNRMKSEGRQAYINGDYKKVIRTYRYLIDSMEVAEDEVSLNLANAYFLTRDTTHALQQYQSLTGSLKPEVKSKAFQQLGIMSYKKEKLEEALNHFKQAVKADRENMDARYDYEMLKRKLEDEKKKNEPSKFAEQVKARAEALSAQGKFQEAYDVMVDGAEKDRSVLKYYEFMTRLREVADINKKRK
jgi:tetratricopeptide (TPR) repeat protein